MSRGNSPERHERPLSVDVAHPIAVAPPPSIRPTWNADTTVDPALKVSGSTTLECCATVPVSGSVNTIRPVSAAAAATPRARAQARPTSKTARATSQRCYARPAATRPRLPTRGRPASDGCRRRARLDGARVAPYLLAAALDQLDAVAIRILDEAEP